MHVVVFGASGKVGRLVVRRLLAEGHAVTAFTHSRNAFGDDTIVNIIQGDIHDPAAVRSAVKTADAVISTLGSWGTPTKDILSSATTHIVPAMRDAGIDRIITLTGSAAWAPGDHITTANRISHAVFARLAGPIIRDAEDHLQTLSTSGLCWTALRAPIMKNGPNDAYALNQRLPSAWETITRESVAAAVVAQLGDTTFISQAPQLHRA